MGGALHVAARAPARPAPSFTPTRAGLLQRCGDGTSGCGCEETHDEDLLQRAPSDAAAGPALAPPIVHGVLAGPGRPLDPGTRETMERSFGHDFGSVRVHTDARASDSARAVHARAYTVGSDLVFATGRYAPDTEDGQRLLAHELAHVVQQRSGAGQHVQRSRLEIAGPSDAAEAEASSAADRVVSGAAPGPIRTLAGPAARLLRTWDPPEKCPAKDPGVWLEKVVVEQEEKQNVTLHWSDGALESGLCSTGKGHCCVDDDTPDGAACSVQGSRVNGSNCTPITEGQGYTITDRYRQYNGWDFWNMFVPSRGIGLHRHHTVEGKALSHGCVRLEMETARKIYCGARQNKTRVQVRGFARPKCSDKEVQKEWESDFTEAGRPATDGEERRTRAEYRRMLREAYGRELKEEEIAAGLTKLEIPRCKSRGALPTTEEARVLPATKAAAATPTAPVRLASAGGFEPLIPKFTGALAGASSFARAQKVVSEHGRGLWQAATKQAQAAGATADDRPLYWARVQMARLLRQWQPSFRLTEAQRTTLQDLFERASRGMETAAFDRDRRTKRILISGFDPFGLGRAIERGNPSGAAALALDGRQITSGPVTAEVEAVVFPVRFADFDAGTVERFFRPYLAKGGVDMIMTISQGGTTEFEVEEFAGRRRAEGRPQDPTDIPENLGQVSGGAEQRPVVPPGLGPGPEFLRTTLPASARRSLGRTTPSRGESEVTEIPRGGTSPVTRPTGGPTAGSTAVEGSGGSFLSNEIFYRTSLLRTETKAEIPVGHLHTPFLAAPGGKVTPQQFATARAAIVTRIEQILTATLPDL
jgi:pyrrolidone-carboxylate peptidase